MNNLASRILYELSNVKEGLTNSEIIRAINNKEILPQNVNYYLQDLVKTGILKKFGNKYTLTKKTFIINGSAVIEFQDKLLILECPYGVGKKGCECFTGESKGKRCLFIENMPKPLKDMFEKNGYSSHSK